MTANISSEKQRIFLFSAAYLYRLTKREYTLETIFSNLKICGMIKMLEFEKEVEEINNILEKGDKISLAAAEIRAEKLKKKVQRTECLERDARIAKIEVIIGTAQAFLGKFDSAMRNLEGALRKHISFDVLNLCDTVKALTMLDISKNRIDVIHEAGILIDDFREFRMAARSLLE